MARRLADLDIDEIRQEPTKKDHRVIASDQVDEITTGRSTIRLVSATGYRPGPSSSTSDSSLA